jgi:sugar transferase EpsL
MDVYKSYGKRWMDIILSLVGLIVLSPMIGVLYLLVCRGMGCPVFFRQQRPGSNGVPFYMYKFRTMTDERDERGELLPDKKRLVGLGRFLRASSLDELPELWNVLKGDMSLVGPRPLLMQYLERYSAEQARRHEARPGITGWAQVNGRNAISWKDKFNLDVWYVDHLSFLLDIKILFLTIKKVFCREGISGGGCETMTEFMGNDE